jgi:phage tail protein X
MKSVRCVLYVVVLLSLSSLVLAQSDAQKSFDRLKALAGTWQAHVTVDPPQKDMGDGALTQISLRVTSRGNALVHEMQQAGTPDDPLKYDHPVTMLYLDGDRLLLTHYCDAGNRPRMAARTSPDGKTVEFDFLDVSGSTQYGHMHHALFTIIDANHHIEDWTYMMPGDKPVRAHFDLQRTK